VTKSWIEKITQAGTLPEVDPSQFNDPLALKTAWTPAKVGGASFQTYKLVGSGPNRFEFKPTLGAKIFYLFFLFLGLAVLLGFVFRVIFYQDSVWGPLIMVPFIGLVFTALGIFLLYVGLQPRTFDKTIGQYWQGKQPPSPYANPAQQKSSNKASTSTPLSQVHALQIVDEYIRTKNNAYMSYEINLVLKDASRVNVLDHANKEKILEDAETLANFLNVKIWNAAH